MNRGFGPQSSGSLPFCRMHQRVEWPENSPILAATAVAAVETMTEFDLKVSDQSKTILSPTIPPRPEPENVRARFASETHSYIGDNIRLADEKAAFFFGASAAILYLLFQSMQKQLASPLAAWTLRQGVGILAMTSLGMACLIGLGVVTPRRGRSVSGHIFFGTIAEFDSRATYVEEVLAMPDQQLISERLEHCYDLARICDRKYRALLWELRTLFVGLILAASYFVFFGT
jgi:hypothetical protein